MRRVAASLLILAMLLPVALAAAPSKRSAGRRKTDTKPLVLDESRKTPIQAMIAAEQAFARLALEKGTRDAFLANLSEDCVLFRPLPVNGHEYMESRPASKSRLLWAPSYAEVAASGDFGVTSGPSEYHPPDDPNGAGISYGNFLSVWRRDPGKDWKVVLDCGISHTKPDTGLGNTRFVMGPEHVPGDAAETKMEAGVLRMFDQSLSTMSWSFNPARAVTYWTAADLHYLKDGEQPRTGDDARNAMSALTRHTAWKPIDCGIARSGDLGFTYGVREDSSEVAGKAPDSTVYVHIWRRVPRNQWKIAAAVDNRLHAK